MATLQKQGVPIPSHLGSGNASQSVSSGSTAAPRQSATRNSTRQSSQSVRHRQSRNTTRSESSSAGIPSPVSAGDSVAGVGLLEAEFILGMLLLVLLMFSSTGSSLSAKIMSTMKRGTLICAVFFILALVAGIGPSATKFAKAFGALVIVAILVTSDMGTVLTDLDNVIKNDWIPTTEEGTDTSADSGTSATQPAGGVAQTAESEALKILKLVGQPGGPLAGPAINGAKAVLGFFGVHLP
jgi:hypothetical protein